MKLYFVRHTTPADSAVSDAQRPLTRQGEEEARLVGAALAGMGVRPARIFSSPLLRARQTAGILGKQLEFAGATETLDELLNGASTSSLVRALKLTGDEIILVGHMPSLADHVAALIGAGNSAGYGMGKGSVACVESSELKAGRGQLVWLKHLSQLKETVS